jgi:NADH dehydrogenase
MAEAIARATLNPDAPNTCELGGPHVYTYKELLAEIAARLGKRPILVSVPFNLWYWLVRIPGSPVGRNQVELMETDTVSSPEMPGFDAFGMAPQPIANTPEKIIVAS